MLTDSTNDTAAASGPATFTVMNCSTAHVHPEDLAALPAASIVAYVDPHGSWVHVPADELDATVVTLFEEGISALFGAVLERAAEHGCAYVRFDADGPLDDTLATSDRW